MSLLKARQLLLLHFILLLTFQYFGNTEENEI